MSSSITPSGLCECGCGQAAPIALKPDREGGYVKGQPKRFIVGHNARGRKASEETRRKMSDARRGRQHSAASRAKMSAANVGRRHTAETRKRISETLRAMQRTGARTHNWKGDAVGYCALHAWVARHKKKTGVCTDCGNEVGTARTTGTEWANVSGRYLRDLDDFIELCIPCHRTRDGRKTQSVSGRHPVSKR
jgi:hypothetical protein